MAKNKVPDSNPDPITGAPGSHPVGTGLGAAAGGAVAGAAAGAVGGPIGAVVGGAVGAVVGGLAGKGVAEGINPTNEDAYWKDNYSTEPYYVEGRTYDDYAPAYRTGYEGRTRYAGRSYSEIEGDLERDYAANRGNGRLEWQDARDATRAAWHRVERTLPGDADLDGR